jgi:hypothetical protein
MATKSKTAMAKPAQTDAVSKRKNSAINSLHSGINAAVVMNAYAEKTYGAIDLQQAVDSLAAAMTEINGGNMRKVENMLLGQSQALQSIFVNLARKAANQEYLNQYETFLRLALKAQSQCRATLETLAAIKNPPIVYARQANVTTGPQQVNNGVAASSHAKEVEIEPNELSEVGNELLPDARASSLTSGVNQEVETVGALDRAEVDRR